MDDDIEDIKLPYQGTEIETVGLRMGPNGEFYFDGGKITTNKVVEFFGLDPSHRFSSFRNGSILANGSYVYGDETETITRDEVSEVREFTELVTAPSNNPLTVSLNTINTVRAISGAVFPPATEVGRHHELIPQANRVIAIAQANGMNANFRMGFHQNISYKAKEGLPGLTASINLFNATIGMVVGEGYYDPNFGLVPSYRSNAIAYGKVMANNSYGGKTPIPVRSVTLKTDGRDSEVFNRAEFRINDFPTGYRASLVTHGSLMMVAMLYELGKLPDFEKFKHFYSGLNSRMFEHFNFIRSIEHDGIHFKVNDAFLIQDTYLKACKEILPLIVDPKLRKVYTKVTELWEQAIIEAVRYEIYGEIPEHPIAGWLYAKRQMELQGDDLFIPSIYRRFDAPNLSPHHIHRMFRVDENTNRFFAVLLQNKIDSKKYLIEHNWNSVTIISRENVDNKFKFDMDVSSGIGNREWVEFTFGTSNPSAEMIQSWVDIQFSFAPVFSGELPI